MRLVAAGVNFRATPLRARERAAAAAADSTTLLRYLIGHGGLAGAAVLSTCNRTEFYVTCPDPLAGEVAPRLARYLDPGDDTGMSRHLVGRFDGEAVRHVFRVGAGLESMVVGEPQVLGQLKDAHGAAREAGTLDARLDYVLRRAISAGKRVRTETGIGRGVSSLSEAALDLAGDVVGGLRGRGVLLLGAGSMNTLAARRLKTIGTTVFVTSRSESAGHLAEAVGGTAISLDALEEVAPTVDVILASTSSTTVVLDRDRVAGLQEARGGRPLCIVDIAVPRDVDPRAADVPGVTLIDIDQLGARLTATMSRRRSAADDAESIIESELESTLRAIGERDSVTPTIAALLQRADEIRRQELARTLDRAEVDEATRARIDAMTKAMVRKLLHAPISRLRESGDDPGVALTLREAFDLDG